MDTAQWPEGIKSMEEKKQQQQQQRAQKPPILNCPRCNSTHTKFCYYNNYSLTQPRYFCKTCRRYWTEGGSLRNVPVGGGSRKNKRPSSSSSPSPSSNLQPPPSSSSSSKITKLDHHHHHMGMGPPPPSHFSSHQNPNNNIIQDQGQDLNLGYPHEFTNLPFNQENKTYPCSSTTSTTTASPQFSAMDFLKSGIASRGFMSSFISMPMQMPLLPVSDSHSNSMNNIYSSAPGIPFQEFKPSLNFSLDGFESGFNNGVSNLQGVQQSGNNNDNTSARLFFPFEELKPTANQVLDDDQQHRVQGQGQEEDSNGYWNGGGSW